MGQTGLLQREVKVLIHRKCNNMLLDLDNESSANSGTLYCPCCRYTVKWLEDVKVVKFFNPVQLHFPNRQDEVEQLPVRGWHENMYRRRLDPRFYEGPK
jgi:hypothetical protein